MMMTSEQVQSFMTRIDLLTPETEALFGKMNAHQMVCHCTDFFRMADGSKKAVEYGVVDPREVIALAKAGKAAPTPKGFGQVEGDGTSPTDFETDRATLKAALEEFAGHSESFDFSEHPFFGKMDFERWIKLAHYHLDHHLKQFGV